MGNFFNKKNLADEIAPFMDKIKQDMDAQRDRYEKELSEKDKLISKANIKIRQYDQLMGMDHEENYIDPVSGLNTKNEFERNREIYRENLTDTGDPFGNT